MLSDNSPRQKAMRKAMRKLVPRVPLADADEILLRARQGHMVSLAPRDAVWLAVVSTIRHQHTDYDALRNEGYDKESARHFVLEATNECLAEWGSSRFIETDNEGF